LKRGKTQPGASVSPVEVSQSHIIESLLKQSGGSVTFNKYVKRFTFLSHDPFIHIEDSSFHDLLETVGRKLGELVGEMESK